MSGISKIIPAILQCLEEHDGEMQGTEQLSLATYTARKSHLVYLVRRLCSNGDITIVKSNGGRGCKTIYKRNPNQTGLPRKTP